MVPRGERVGQKFYRSGQMGGGIPPQILPQSGCSIIVKTMAGEFREGPELGAQRQVGALEGALVNSMGYKPKIWFVTLFLVLAKRWLTGNRSGLCDFISYG